MGVQDLWQLVKGCARSTRLNELKSGYTIAIDATLLIYKYFCVIWSVQIKKTQLRIDDIVNTIYRNICSIETKFAKYKCVTIWCFDGNKNKEKLATKKRIDDKQAKINKAFVFFSEALAIANRLKISNEELDFFGQFFKDNKSLKIVFSDEANNIDADTTVIYVSEVTEVNFMMKISDMKDILKNTPIMPFGMTDIFLKKMAVDKMKCLKVDNLSEGEKLASILCHIGVANAVFSNDSDLIPMGTKTIIKEINGDELELYHIDDIISTLGLNIDGIINLSIILGCDYNIRIRGYGPVKAIKTVKTNNFSIKDFEEKNGCENVRYDECCKHFQISENDKEIVAKIMIVKNTSASPCA